VKRLAALVAVGFAWLSTPSATAATDPVTLGKDLYVERCVLCHGTRGHGWEWTQKVAKPPVPVPDLAETVPTRDDAFLRTAILDGGKAIGASGIMPAFRFNMSEAEAEAVIRYLRSLGKAR
jgi:mono/diheme cytochrome c family protein